MTRKNVRKVIFVAALLWAGAAFADAPPPPLTDKEIIEEPLEKVAPKYPNPAFYRDIEGFVLLSVVVGPDGRVTNVTVTKAEPPGWFEEEALKAVKQWRYKPPGRVMTFEVEVRFEIPEEFKEQMRKLK
jgi:TonB family protein